jgi:hypothetical protein
VKDWPIVTPGMPDGYVPPSAALTRPEPQALRVAALERDLESVRAQRDRTVEALWAVMRENDLYCAPYCGSYTDSQFMTIPCGLCIARAVLAELGGAADE